MEITFTTGISVITVVALFNGIATTIKLLRQRDSNGFVGKALESIQEALNLMNNTQIALIEVQRSIVEAQKANVLVTDSIQNKQQDFVVCFQKMETSAAERSIYLKGILDELKAMNKDRR